jgi:hypothetical protein
VAVAEAADIPAAAGCYALGAPAAAGRVAGVSLPKRLTLEPTPVGADAFVLAPAPKGGTARWASAPGDTLRLAWTGARGDVELVVGPPDDGGVRRGTVRAATARRARRGRHARRRCGRRRARRAAAERPRGAAARSARDRRHARGGEAHEVAGLERELEAASAGADVHRA